MPVWLVPLERVPVRPSGPLGGLLSPAVDVGQSVSVTGSVSALRGACPSASPSDSVVIN